MCKNWENTPRRADVRPQEFSVKKVGSFFLNSPNRGLWLSHHHDYPSISRHTSFLPSCPLTLHAPVFVPSVAAVKRPLWSSFPTFLQTFLWIEKLARNSNITLLLIFSFIFCKARLSFHGTFICCCFLKSPSLHHLCASTLYPNVWSSHVFSTYVY